MNKYKEIIYKTFNLNVKKNIKNNPLIKLSKYNYNMELKKNIFILDYIFLVKIISAFLVILKHTNRNYSNFNKYWISTNIMASFCMCAVPLFSLCIGATLLNFNERYNIIEYWKRRIKKVILPIIGWNMIYYFYRVYILNNFKEVQLNFISLYKVYFYNELYPIIGSLRIFLFGYMVIPLIAYIDKTNKIKIYSYCFITLLINQSLIPYLLIFDNNYKLLWPYNYNLGYIIYIFSGYIIQNSRFNKIIKLLIYISGIIGLLLRLIIAHYLTLKYKKVDKTQINYVNLPIVFYSCSLFLFIKENCVYLFKVINIKIINKIGSLSMGPFFLHYMIIWGLPRILNYSQFSFNYRFFGAFEISIICFIITAIMKKIPLIKYLIP